ncbi:MAG: cytochrome b/b6 domain-containing protein [Alphaproteobacteria bacterium]
MADADNTRVRVWDPAVRVFHWALVLAYAVAYLTEADVIGVHRVAGYAVGVIVALRIVWGFVGPRHARFADFVYRPRTVLGYLRDLVTFRSKRYLGHSPGGGVMVVALLVMLALAVATGIAADQGDGAIGSLGVVPSAVADDDDESDSEARDDSWFGALHEALANLSLILVFMHVGGVALASLVHRENLVRAMVTGLKPARPEKSSTRM